MEAMRVPSNREVAEKLYELANYMEIDGQNPFRVNAYRRAARTVEHLKRPLAEIDEDLTTFDGIGKGTAQAIRETLAQGEPALLESYRKKFPNRLMALLDIPGLGPKSVKVLYQKLGVQSVEDLKQALKENKVRDLPGFGTKKEAKLIEAVSKYTARPERLLLGQALPLAEALVQDIAALPGVENASVAGSVRRMKATVKDIDIIVAAEDPGEVAVRVATQPFVYELISRGPKKVSFYVKGEWLVQVDVRLVTPPEYATTFHHLTGSKAHNVRIRQLAKAKGWKVSEYGVEKRSSGETVTFPDEEAFFHALGLPYLPPEVREGTTEMAFQGKDAFPRLVTSADVRGDLHLHSQWSDGHHTIRDMALKAKALGYEYIAITDHSRSLRVAGGLAIDELMEQREAIAQVNEAIDGITVLAGTEMEILSDGRLDYPDDVLSALDFVIASVHSAFAQDEKTMTKRLLSAVEHPHIHMIAHPSGRLLNRRDAYAVNWDELFKRAAETGTILEINAHPQRLDLHDSLLKRAKEEYGVKFAINSDAHRVEGFHVMRYGVGMARRGWLTRDDVVNTWTLDQLYAFIRMKGK